MDGVYRSEGEAQEEGRRQLAEGDIPERVRARCDCIPCRLRTSAWISGLSVLLADDNLVTRS